MTEQKRRILMTVLIAGSWVILLVLGVLYAITEHAVLSCVFRIYFAAFKIPVILYLITKGLKKEEKRLYKRALWLCGIVLFLDLVVVEGIRLVLSGGISTVLFLPACAPICLMVIELCSKKEDRLIERKVTFWVCIPLLILSLYFEVLAFIQL